MDADGNPTGAVNTAGYNIHAPVLAARPDAVSAAHTHTAFGTPWSANVEPFRAISQESVGLRLRSGVVRRRRGQGAVLRRGKRIATALGDTKLCILRNHCGGANQQPHQLGEGEDEGEIEEQLDRIGREVLGWFGEHKCLHEPTALRPAATTGQETVPAPTGWRMFQWLLASRIRSMPTRRTTPLMSTADTHQHDDHPNSNEPLASDRCKRAVHPDARAAEVEQDACGTHGPERRRQRIGRVERHLLHRHCRQDHAGDDWCVGIGVDVTCDLAPLDRRSLLGAVFERRLHPVEVGPPEQAGEDTGNDERHDRLSGEAAIVVERDDDRVSDRHDDLRPERRWRE